MQERDKRPLKYPVEITVEDSRHTALARLLAVANDFLALPLKKQRYPYEIAPPAVFMHITSKEENVSPRVDFQENTLVSSLEVSLQPGESRTFHIILGLQDRKHYSSIHNQITSFMDGADTNDYKEGMFAQLWKAKLRISR